MQHAQITLEYFKGEKHYVRKQMMKKMKRRDTYFDIFVWIEFCKQLTPEPLLALVTEPSEVAVTDQLEQVSLTSTARADVRSQQRASFQASDAPMSASWLYRFLVVWPRENDIWASWPVIKMRIIKYNLQAT